MTEVQPNTQAKRGVAASKTLPATLQVPIDLDVGHHRLWATSLAVTWTWATEHIMKSSLFVAFATVLALLLGVLLPAMYAIRAALSISDRCSRARLGSMAPAPLPSTTRTKVWLRSRLPGRSSTRPAFRTSITSVWAKWRR